MKNPDEAVERVLQGLREAEAPQGMERRILEAVQMRSVQAGSSRRSILSALMWNRPWALVSAGIVVISLAASIALHRRQPVERDVLSSTAPGTPHASGGHETQSGFRSEVAATTRPAHERAIQQSRIESSTATMEVVSDEDALAISEMNAPSHPAPPMPLTDQEKLLVSVIHRGDPVELAMLDQKFRSSVLANSKAQFDAFFAQPEPSQTNQPAPDIQPATKEKE